MGLGVGSQVERGFSWERKGPLKAWVMALRLKAHTAEAAILLLYREMVRRREGEDRREEKKVKIKILFKGSFIIAYILAANVKLQSASSCVIKPFSKVLWFNTCAKQAPQCPLALAAG